MGFQNNKLEFIQLSLSLNILFLLLVMTLAFPSYVFYMVNTPVEWII